MLNCALASGSTGPDYRQASCDAFQSIHSIVVPSLVPARPCGLGESYTNECLQSRVDVDGCERHVKHTKCLFTLVFYRDYHKLMYVPTLPVALV